ncbi:MAG: hypothetical protein J5I50_00365 [Chitinophagaceae bacterium]|nr:hypothetical protein [Chitinophagaceae bacterium]
MNGNINNAAQLSAAIQKLEAKRDRQEEELAASFHEVAAELTPKNIIKNAVKGVTDPKNLNSNLLKLAVGIGGGLVAKKLVGPTNGTSTQKLIGRAIRLGLEYFIGKRKK